MDIVYLEARKRIEFNHSKIDKDFFDELKDKNVCVIGTIQYLDFVVRLRDFLQSRGINVIIFKGKHSKYDLQVLGCDVLDINNDALTKLKHDVDVFVYVGDGTFHPKSLLFKFNKPVYCLNPITYKATKLDDTDVEAMLTRQKAALVKFLSSKHIGIIVTLKPGQNKLNLVNKYMEKVKAKFGDKEFYIFLDDTINFSELENFSFIECFINTACPRIAYDDTIKISKPVLDFSNLLKLIEQDN